MKKNNSNIVQLKDEAIIASYAKTGEVNLVGELYNRYARLVFGVCLKYLKNKEESADVMIKIFEKLLDDLKRYEIQNFKSWLYTYTKNACLMSMRKRVLTTSEKDVFEFDAKLKDESTQNDIEEKILLLEDEVEKLENEQKTCIKLFYIENKSYTQIMTETGFSFNQIKSCIQNGKRNLKLRMNSILSNE